MRTSFSLLATLSCLLLAPATLAQYGPDNTANPQDNTPYGTPANPPGNGNDGTPSQDNNEYPASAPTAASPDQTPGEQPEPGSCAARMKEYLDSLACFEPYRHGPHVIDIEAYKHCKVVKEPADCRTEP